MIPDRLTAPILCASSVLAVIFGAPGLAAAQEMPPPWVAGPPVAPQAPQAAPRQSVVYVDAYGRPVAPESGLSAGAANLAGPGGPSLDPRPPRPPVRLRGFVSANLGVIGYQSSPFRTASRAWGYDAFSTALNIAVEAGANVHNALLLGARVSWSNSSGGEAAFDHAVMTLNAFDFSAIARVGYPIPLGRNDWIFYPGFQFEFGALYASTSLRREASGAMIPRGAGQFVLVFSDLHAGLGLRLGYQYAAWPDAAGSGESLSFGGFLVSLGLEVRL